LKKNIEISLNSPWYWRRYSLSATTILFYCKRRKGIRPTR